VGDPINTVRIFSEKLVDELIVLDIDATVNKVEPNFNLISKLAAESNGMFFPYQQIADFPAVLKKQNPSKQVIVETDIVQELISFKFLLFALFLLAAMEWFVRKWNGFI
jgi:hypothetical protein